MKRWYTVALFLGWSLCSYGQLSYIEDHLDNQWPRELLRKASVNDDVRFMNNEEKQVIFYCNLARLNGPLFISTVLEPYLSGRHIRNDHFVRSLIRTLETQKPAGALEADELLYELAYDHARESGRNGTTGHGGFQNRFQKAKNRFWTFAENCYYGQVNAMDIALELLIDRGESDLGHRKNILNNQLDFIGVAIQPHHSVYEFNCVMDMGGKRH